MRAGLRLSFRALFSDPGVWTGPQATSHRTVKVSMFFRCLPDLPASRSRLASSGDWLPGWESRKSWDRWTLIDCWSGSPAKNWYPSLRPNGFVF